MVIMRLYIALLSALKPRLYIEYMISMVSI